MNSEIIKKFCDLLGEERVFTGEAMSRHTTFKIGGPADYFLMPDKDTDVGRIVKSVKKVRSLILSSETEAIFW